jgi:hypothetical protein
MSRDAKSHISVLQCLKTASLGTLDKVLLANVDAKAPCFDGRFPVVIYPQTYFSLSTHLLAVPNSLQNPIWNSFVLDPKLNV